MRALVIINPSSGDFEAERRWPVLEPILARLAELTVLHTEKDQARTTARIMSALDQRPDRVIAIGGDGTAHQVINAMMSQPRRAELAVIPFGTANDVAKSLKLPFDEPEKMAEIAAGDKLSPLDIGRVLATREEQTIQKYFVDAVTVGMDADVLAARGNYRELGGYLAYAAALAERALEQQSLDVRATVDGRSIDTRVFNAVINNVPVYAGELEMPGARADDGLLDLYLFDRGEYASKLASFAIKQLDILKLGVHEAIEEITENQRTYHGQEIRLRLASPRRVQVDGELLGEADELECTIAGRLQVAVP